MSMPCLNHVKRYSGRLTWPLPSLLAGLLVCFVGCQPSGPTSSESAGRPPADTQAASEESTSAPVTSTAATPASAAAEAESTTAGSPAKSALATTPVSVRVGGSDEYAQMLAELKGNVVLVDFWATWCVPCVKQLPHTIELSKQHADQGLRVFTVNFDDPEADQAKVQQFLEKRQAGLATLISKYGVGTESTTAFEMVGGGALPGYKLYDRQGQLRFMFCENPAEGEAAEPVEMIDQRVAELLAESATPPVAE